jgi:ribosomal protein L7/L12
MQMLWQVSSEARACPHCRQPDPQDGFARARAELSRGNKINAIKIVREQTGSDLKDAKDLVESWEG